MKQTAIARKHKMDPTALSKALNGKYRVIPTLTAIKLAKILEWPVEKVVKSPHTKLKARFYSLYEFNGDSTNGKAPQRKR